MSNWELTAQILQNPQNPIIKKPALTDKYLSKPPFRFLHDVITAVQHSTGFAKGLYNDAELDAKAIQDKESKVAYLAKVIDVVSIVLNEPVPAKPLKVVAGLEPEATNVFLQMLGKACKMDATKAVQKVLAKSGGAAPAAEKAAHAPAEKAARAPAEKAAHAPAAEKATAEPSRPSSRPSSQHPKEEEKSSSSSKTRSSKEGEKVKSSSSSSKSKEKPPEEKKEDKEEKKKEDKKEKEKKEDKKADADDKPSKSSSKSSSSSKSKPKDDAAAAAESTAREASSSDAAKFARPQSARKAPPKVPAANAPPPPAASRPARKGPAGAAPPERPGTASGRPGAVPVNVYEENVKNDDDDDVEVVTEQAPPAFSRSMAAAGEQGVLVKNIIEAERSLKEAGEKAAAPTEEEGGGTGIILGRRRGTGAAQTTNTKADAAAVRELVQKLVQSSHPLAKSMDYLQEDLDNMAKEYRFWVTERRVYQDKLMEEQRYVNDASRLAAQLADQDNQIRQAKDRILGLKAQVLRNEETVAKLLGMATGGR